jgi:hypothetical protein
MVWAIMTAWNSPLSTQFTVSYKKAVFFPNFFQIFRPFFGKGKGGVAYLEPLALGEQYWQGA